MEEVKVTDVLNELMQDDSFFPDPELRAVILNVIIGMLTNF